jgi:hypothetical protein
MSNCACSIADKPCGAGCRCFDPDEGTGDCLCCATHGSGKQRKEHANFIVEVMRGVAKQMAQQAAQQAQSQATTITPGKTLTKKRR